MFKKKQQQTLRRRCHAVPLTSSRSLTASVLPQRAASCRAVPALVCLLMSIPAWINSLVAGHRGQQKGEINTPLEKRGGGQREGEARELDRDNGMRRGERRGSDDKIGIESHRS